MARFDRVIPPGGTGNITLTIDTNIVMGKFRKRTVVWSDDPDRRSMALYLLGEVKPYISVEPEDSLSFIGVKGKVPPQHINMLNNTKDPIKITKIENPLMDHIRYKLNEVKPGYVYSLEIEDISQVNGDYVGHLSVHTDHSQMSELIIMIRGQISD